MDSFLYYIRDNLSGFHYFIYAYILLFFMFAIIGYLFKQKFAVYEIKLNTSQKEVSNKKEQNKSNKEIKGEPTKPEVKTELKKESQKVVQSVNNVVNGQNVQTKELETKKNDVKEGNNQVIQPTQMNSQTLTPTPMPTTPVVKKAEPLPAKPTEVVATMVTNEVKNNIPNKINEPIPEIK